MKKYEVNSIKKCQQLNAWLQGHGYSQFQWQYDAMKPDGFFIWFISIEGLEEVEVHTFNPTAQDMLVKYKKPDQ